MEVKSIYILQGTEEYNDELTISFEKEGFKVVGKTTNGSVGIEEIKVKSPDFVILELVLPAVDGMGVLKQIRTNNPKTKIIVLSALNSEQAVSKAVFLGASYFISKPCAFSVLLNCVKENISMEKTNNDNSVIANGDHALNEGNKNYLDEKISKIFINVGIPPHIKGYSFLREGVKMVVNEPSIINNITKKLYPMIGEKYVTSASKVERAIRHAIEVAWNRGRIDSINNILGVKAYVGQEKPTNGEFIALIADKMLLEMN